MTVLREAIQQAGLEKPEGTLHLHTSIHYLLTVYWYIGILVYLCNGILVRYMYIGTIVY